jgi:hypothetical protein
MRALSVPVFVFALATSAWAGTTEYRFVDLSDAACFRLVGDETCVGAVDILPIPQHGLLTQAALLTQGQPPELLGFLPGGIISRAGLRVATTTLQHFVTRSHRLYEQELREGGTFSQLGDYVRRWWGWVRAGVAPRKASCSGRVGGARRTLPRPHPCLGAARPPVTG